MKRSLPLALIAITALIIASVPSSTCNLQGLVESGTTQTFESNIVFAECIGDNTF